MSANIIIADDHPLFRAALRQAVVGALPDVQIRETDSFDGIITLLEAADDVDLALLDLSMPGMRGFSGLLYLRAQYPQVPAAIVSAIEDESVIRAAIDYGAIGYIPKSVDIGTIGTAISVMIDGDVWLPDDLGDANDDTETAEIARRLTSLTPQQVRVLMMLSEGKLNKQIAYELSISEATVKAHVSAILQKLGANSRTQAVIIAGNMVVENAELNAARTAATTPPRQD